MAPALSLPHQLRQKLPQKHSHYAFQDFFQFNAETGTITDWNDSRNILSSEDFIVGLLEGLESEVGEASAAVMYSSGLSASLT